MPNRSQTGSHTGSQTGFRVALPRPLRSAAKGLAVIGCLVATVTVAPAPTAAAEGPASRIGRETIRFPVGSSVLSDEMLAALERLATEIRKRPADEKIFVVGHTDRRGSRATNLRLSKQRAQTVRNGLARLGVETARMEVVGRGPDEPLSTADGPEADALNRRVELWVGKEVPLAWVSWIHRSVESRPPDPPSWSKAQLDQPLKRNAAVRARERSAGEITFRSGNTLYVGSDAYAVIYGDAPEKGRSRSRAVDVRVDEGDAFARLARLEGVPLVVQTPAADTLVRSRGTRIGHSPSAKRTTVSVYDGEAEVEAQGKKLPVKQGFGTRVVEGEPPEDATALIAAPRWRDGKLTALDVATGSTVAAAFWEPPVEAEAVEVQLTTAADRDFHRPIRAERTEQRSAVLGDLEPGTYWIRLVSIDGRGIPGELGPARELIVRVKPRPKPAPKPAPPPRKPEPATPISWRKRDDDKAAGSRGPYGAVRVGGNALGQDGALDFWLAGEVGVRARLGELISLDLGAQLSGTARPLIGRDGNKYRVTVVPLQLRAGLVFETGTMRPYFGGALGAAAIHTREDARAAGLKTQTVRPAWAAFVGTGIELGPGEVLVEVAFSRDELDSDDLDGSLGGLMFSLGYRFTPGWN